ncbi:MAG: TonB-dependent receptor [Proteobacteria bacterium]|nr:TonB-dependent receptor [Pseudomonadota bacterium]
MGIAQGHAYSALLLTAGLATVLVPGARAAEPAAAAQGPDTKTVTSDGGNLETVVVTAQGRRQQAQEVPISLQVVGEKQIEALAATDLSKLNGYVPGLVVDSSQPTQPGYTLRGISVGDFGIGTDSPIGVYQDGVYTGKTGGALLLFNDVQRVEVLKGPQGTLFGRNSAAGAISVATNTPTQSWEGAARLRLGNYGTRYVDGMLNVPLGPDLAARFTVVDNRSNGWLRDVASGRRTERDGDFGARGQLRWNAPGDTTVRLALEYEHLNQPARPAVSLLRLPLAGGAAPYPADPATFVNPIDAPLYNDAVGDQEARDFYGATLFVQHDFGAVTFNSTTAWRHFWSINREDFDGTNLRADYVDSLNRETNTSWSQEFRLSGKNRVADWIAGASYYYDNAYQVSGVRLYTDSIDTVLNNTGALPGGLYGPLSAAMQGFGLPYSLLGDLWEEDMYNQGVSHAGAVYGDVIWHLADRWDLTTGGRYTHDERQISWYYPQRQAPQLDATLSQPLVQGFLQAAGVPLQAFYQNLQLITPVVTPVPLHGSNNWNDFSPRVVLNYKPDTNTLLYVSWTRGYQAGGFNALAPVSHYAPEKVRSYEAGLKSYLPAYRLTFNASLYYYQYLDLQSLTLVQNGVGQLPQYLVTISNQQAHGADLEAHWNLTDGLRLDVTGAWINSRYDSNTQVAGADVSGQPTGEPSFSYAVGLDYLWRGVAGGDVDLSLMNAHRGATRCNAGSAAQGSCVSLPAFTVGGSQNRTDARLGWSSGHWNVAVYANNLFDKRYVTGISNVTTPILGTPYAGVTAPRTWGVQFGLQF